MANGALADKADLIEGLCKEYYIDPYLVTAIMAHETGYGTSSAILNKNNPGGMMSSSGLITYNSLDEGIEAVIRNLSNNYVHQEGNNLTTVSQIGAKYCPVGAANDPTGLNGNWIPAIVSIYNDLTGKNIDANTALC